MPWAAGTFNGGSAEAQVQATFTVAANGSISGKYLVRHADFRLRTSDFRHNSNTQTLNSLTQICPLPTAYFLLPTAYSLLPTAYSLFPIPYCLFSVAKRAKRSSSLASSSAFGLSVQ